MKLDRVTIDRRLATLGAAIAAASVDAVAIVPGTEFPVSHRRALRPFSQASSTRLAMAQGLDVHESSQVMRGADTALEPGMVITIEPELHAPGLRRVSIEDDLLVTESGAGSLTPFLARADGGGNRPPGLTFPPSDKTDPSQLPTISCAFNRTRGIVSS